MAPNELAEGLFVVATFACLSDKRFGGASSLTGGVVLLIMSILVVTSV